MGKSSAVYRDGRKEGRVQGWEEGGWGRGMVRRRAGQRDGKKVDRAGYKIFTCWFCNGKLYFLALNTTSPL